MLGEQTVRKWGRNRPEKSYIVIPGESFFMFSLTDGVFGDIRHQLVDEGSEDEEPEGVVHLPGQANRAEGVGVFEERGLHQRYDDGWQAVADQDQGPGGNCALQEGMSYRGVGAEETSLVRFSYQVQQKTRQTHDKDADEVHNDHTDHLLHSN